MEKPIEVWLAFFATVLGLIVLDLGVLNKKDEAISFKKSIYLSLFFISIGLLYGALIYIFDSPASGIEYFTGFIVEKSLSLDNIFVIAVIFNYFAIPPKYQHKVLFWGIMGVIVLRGIMIFAGVEIVERFHFILYLFGGVLIFTGVKLLWMLGHKPDIKNNLVIKLLKKFCNVTDQIHDSKFLVKIKGKTYLTPLLVALIVIEFMDLIFAVDSIPAIFAITLDPYIIYTSNIFAILGLRSLFFVLESLIIKFKYLKHSLAILLIFIGSKIFIKEVFHLPNQYSLLIVVMILSAGVIASIRHARKMPHLT